MGAISCLSALKPFLVSFFVHTALGAALKNITLPLPPDTSNHNTPGLLCTPTGWTDVAAFFLFNYVAHAATVLMLPGERSFDYAASVVGSLLFPALGLYRGVEAILSGALSSKNDLEKAVKSGALCMLVRSPDWSPVDKQSIQGAVIRRGKSDNHSKTLLFLI
jgi:hypothetical protein